MLERAAVDAGWRPRFRSDMELAELDPAEVADHEIVLVLNLPPEAGPGLAAALAAARQLRPGLPLLALDQRDSQAGLERRGLLERDPELTRYWTAGGLENYRRMYAYLAASRLGRPTEVLPPVPVPLSGLWHPAADQVFSGPDDFLAWAGAEGRLIDGAPRVALVAQASFILFEDTRVHAAVIEELERCGIQAVVFFAQEQNELLGMLRAWGPELLLDDGHASPALLAGSRELDIPQIKMISMLRSTLEEWRASPLGLEPGDVSLHLLTQEVYGIIDPQVVGGLVAQLNGYRLHEPDPERVRHFAGRVEAWLALRSKPPADKRVALIYYHKYLGGADLLRGSPSGAFLDGPESMLLFLRALRDHGWKVDPLPADAEELLAWLRRRGVNVGSWAAGDLARLVREGDPVLLPVEDYLEWFAELPAAVQERVVETHGPAPGGQMVWRENGRDFFVLPRIDLGGVLLMPQPARGPENDEELLHSRDIPPPHQYLAAYLWLQKRSGADAVVHFGTHGSELLLPTRGAGLGPDDFGDICLGSLPNITPWVLDNVAEATLARRRAYAVLVDHLTPPYEAAGLAPELAELARDLDKFSLLEEGVVRQRYRERIEQGARAAGFLAAEEVLADAAAVERLRQELHGIRNRAAPMSLHVLGRSPEEQRVAGMVTSMLGWEFLESRKERAVADAEVLAWLRGGSAADETVAPADREWLDRARDYQRRLLDCGGEIRNLLRALDGRFVPPGPGNDPQRNPDAAPTGRNLYALNPEEIPTPPAWEIGVELAEALLESRPDLRKAAIDLNAFETMRDYGVMEAEVLWLMGLRPMWDENQLVVDVELVPREQLGRPRVEVFLAISGAMRDNFPSRVRLLDRAVRLAAAADEPDNAVRAGVEALRAELRAGGYSPERAELLGAARIFGQRPGEYGTRILYLVPKSGSWQDEEEIARVYRENMAYVYTGDLWGERVEGLYASALSGSELVLRNWASNMMSPLSNHHVFEYAGGLSLAIESVDGAQPELLINDVRAQPRLRDFDEVMREEFHATVLNPRWVRGMMEHDYAGAGQMAELVKNSFGWEATRSGAVSGAMWDSLYEVYVEDRYQAGLEQWFGRVNPAAFQEIAATLLEAGRKGYWEAGEERLAELARRYVESVVEHGLSSGLVAGGNEPLRETVRRLLGGSPDAGLLPDFEAEVARAEQAPEGAPLRGLELAEASSEAAEAPDPAQSGGEQLFSLLAKAAGLAAAGLILAGFLRRSGAAG